MRLPCRTLTPALRARRYAPPLPPGRDLQDCEHVLGRPADRGLAVREHQGSLDQDRVGRHRVDQLLAGELPVFQAELGIDRLALAHQVARLQAEQVEGVRDLRGRRRVLLVVHDHGFDAALAQQIEGAARLGATRIVPEGDAGRSRHVAFRQSREGPPPPLPRGPRPLRPAPPRLRLPPGPRWPLPGPRCPPLGPRWPPPGRLSPANQLRTDGSSWPGATPRLPLRLGRAGLSGFKTLPFTSPRGGPRRRLPRLLKSSGRIRSKAASSRASSWRTPVHAWGVCSAGRISVTPRGVWRWCSTGFRVRTGCAGPAPAVSRSALTASSESISFCPGRRPRGSSMLP